MTCDLVHPLRRRLLGAAALAPVALVARDGFAQAVAPARALDVPYVPTPMPVVDAMLHLAGVKKSDMLIDLGCGDGRIVIRAAERFGCRGIGVDLDPLRVSEAEQNAREKKVQHLVRFVVGDVFEFDFSQATVVTMYLLPSINLKLRPRLLAELAPGTRIVSHDFGMGDWRPERQREVENSVIYLWTVPPRGQASPATGK
jgi:SAM-dependent methyltransferase